MMRNAKAGNKTPRQFRDAALPWLDDAYAFALVLMRTEMDAERAVQECYQRALHRFDGFRGTAIRPWLLAILSTVCQEKTNLKRDPSLGRRSTAEPAAGNNAMAHQPDTPTILQLIGDLPAPLGETIALREVLNLTYEEIAEVGGVSVTTVVSRIGDARGLLLAARRTAKAL